MDTFPGILFTVLAFSLIEFDGNVQGQTQGGGVAIGLGMSGADFMMDTAFGELPSPLVAMAAEGTGANSIGSSQGSASQTGSGFNTHGFSLFGLDPHTSQPIDTSRIAGVANGQTIFLPGNLANQLFSGSPVILPDTSPSTQSTTPDPNAGYILRNEDFTALGNIGHLVRVPISSLASGQDTSVSDTSSQASQTLEETFTINPNDIIGVADMNQIGPDGTMKVLNFNPGTGHASELAALQSHTLGSAVDMTDLLPPPFDQQTAHSEINLNSVTDSGKLSTTSSISSLNVNIGQTSSDRQSVTSANSDWSSASSSTGEGKNQTEGYFSDISSLAHSALDVNVGAASDQGSVHTNEESMFNTNLNNSHVVNVNEQSMFGSSVDSVSLDIKHSLDSFSGTQTDKGLNNNLDTKLPSTSLNPGRTDALSSISAENIKVFGSESSLLKAEAGQSNRASKMSEHLLDNTKQESASHLKVNIDDVTRLDEKLNGVQRTDSRSNTASKTITNTNSNADVKRLNNLDRRLTSGKFGVAVLTQTNQRPDSHDIASAMEIQKSTVALAVTKPAVRLVSTLTDKLVTPSATSAKAVDQTGSLDFTTVSDFTQNTQEGISTLTPSADNKLLVDSVQSSNIQTFEQQPSETVPHVSDLSSEGLYPFEGSFAAMDATLQEGTPAILDMNSVLVGHESLHLEPAVNIGKEVLPNSTPSSDTGTGIYAAVDSKSTTNANQHILNEFGVGLAGNTNEEMGTSSNRAAEITFLTTATPQNTIKINSAMTVSDASEHLNNEITMYGSGGQSDTSSFTVSETSSGQGLAVLGNVSVDINMTNNQEFSTNDSHTAFTDSVGNAVPSVGSAPIANVRKDKVSGGISVTNFDGLDLNFLMVDSSRQETKDYTDQSGTSIEGTEPPNGSFIIGAGQLNSKIITGVSRISNDNIGGFAIGSGAPDLSKISLPQKAFFEKSTGNTLSGTDDFRSAKVDMSSFTPPPYIETSANDVISNGTAMTFEFSIGGSSNADKTSQALNEKDSGTFNIRTQRQRLNKTTTQQSEFDANTAMSAMLDASEIGKLSVITLSAASPSPKAPTEIFSTVSATDHSGKDNEARWFNHQDRKNVNKVNFRRIAGAESANGPATINAHNIQDSGDVSNIVSVTEHFGKQTISDANILTSTNNVHSSITSGQSFPQTNRFPISDSRHEHSGGVVVGHLSNKPIVGTIFGASDTSETNQKVDRLTQKFLERSGITNEPDIDFMSSFLKTTRGPNLKNVNLVQLGKTVTDHKIVPSNSDANIVDKFGVADIYTRKQQLNPEQWQKFISENAHKNNASQRVIDVAYMTRNVLGEQETKPLNGGLTTKTSLTGLLPPKSSGERKGADGSTNQQGLLSRLGSQRSFTDMTGTATDLGSEMSFSVPTGWNGNLGSQSSIAGSSMLNTELAGLQETSSENKLSNRGLFGDLSVNRQGAAGGTLSDTLRSRNPPQPTSSFTSTTRRKAQTVDSAVLFAAPGMSGHKSVTIVNYKPSHFDRSRLNAADSSKGQELRNTVRTVGNSVGEQQLRGKTLSGIDLGEGLMQEFVGSQATAEKTSEFANAFRQNRGVTTGSEQQLRSGTGQAVDSFARSAGQISAASAQSQSDQGQLGESGKKIQSEMNTFKLGKSILISDGVIPEFSGSSSIRGLPLEASDLNRLSAAGLRLGEPSVLSGSRASGLSTFTASRTGLAGDMSLQNVQGSSAAKDDQLFDRTFNQNEIGMIDRNRDTAIIGNMNANLNAGVSTAADASKDLTLGGTPRKIVDAPFEHEIGRSMIVGNRASTFSDIKRKDMDNKIVLNQMGGQPAGVPGSHLTGQNFGIAMNNAGFDQSAPTFDHSSAQSATDVQSSSSFVDSAGMSTAGQSSGSDTITILGLNEALSKQPMEATLFTSGSRFAVFGHANDAAGKSLASKITKPIPARRMGVLGPVQNCRYKPDPTSEYYFIYKNGVTQHRFRCALGTAFDEMTCECSIRVSDHGDCLEVHMDFNNGVVEDSSLNRLPVGNENVEITNSSSALPGIALFGGDSKLTVWRYQNYDFRDHVMLKVQFRPGVGGDRLQPLISNCDGSANGPSVGIIYDNVMQEVILMLQTVNDTMKELRFKVNADEWNDVTYIYDGQEFIGIVNGVRRYVSREDPHLLGIIGGEIKSTPAQGLIEIQDAPIVLGYCPIYGYYRGAMVDIQIYTCIPKDFRLE